MQLVPYGLYFGQEMPNRFQVNRNLLEQMRPTTWEDSERDSKPSHRTEPSRSTPSKFGHLVQAR